MSKLQIVPLGGMGSVTQNMYLYIYENEILIMDCGIGFPDIQMPGADILIPDTRHLHHLLDEGKEIVGMVLSHGHDDHIAATPYILPELPDFPVYGSALTAGFAENRMKDGDAPRPVEVVKDGQWTTVGQHFSFTSVAVTHSVPDTKHYFIKTPAGTIYHGTDFKLDENPVDNVMTDEAQIKQLASEGEGVLCMLVDCLGDEKDEWIKSESTVGPTLQEEMANVAGKVIVTLMSSHIHRIQQVVDIAREQGRKLVFVGRSVEQNVEVALRLGKLDIDKKQMIDKRKLNNYKDSELCIIIAGSQGQEGSSLVRAVFGDHRAVQIKDKDKVIFSASVIPGNEVPYYQAVNELCRNGIDVVYPYIVPDLHQSGHGSAPEQQHLVSLVKPKYVMPIGGEDRHRVKFLEFVADKIDFPREKVLLPDHGEVVSFTGDGVNMSETISIIPRIVDGLGIGDVGPRVLNDRRTLGEAGMLVILLKRQKNGFDTNNIQVISRGFVFMKDAGEVIDFIKAETKAFIKKAGNMKDRKLIHDLERSMSKKLYKTIQREPLVIVEMID